MGAALTTGLLTCTWRPLDVRLAPVGRRVAWVAAPYGAEGEHDESAIWVAHIDDPASARRWTFGGEDTMPRWSPDGSRLAFLSDRANRGTAGLYVMPADGGEAAPLVLRQRAISAFAWSPDGLRLAFLAPDEPDDEDRRRERERDDGEVQGERWQLHRLWTAELSTGQVTSRLACEGHVVAVDWSPSTGGTLAVIVQPTPELDSARLSRICLVDPRGEAPSATPVCDSPWAEDLCFTSDGDRLVFVAHHEANVVSALTVWSVPAEANGTATIIGPGADESACAVRLRVVPGDPRTVIQVLEGLETRLEWCHPASGHREVLWEAAGDVACFDVGREGLLATAHHSADDFLEVWAGQPEHMGRLSDHHAALRAIPLGTVEDFRFTAPDDWDLDGVLIRPPGAAEGPWPTVVLLHGGPYGRSGRQLHFGPSDWGQWLATAGYAVLMPNYRGGMGRGQAFAASVRADMGGAEWRDVLAAVDAAVERGIADESQLGIGGGSQGGFLTAWAVTQTDRFRAGVIGAGPTDWSMLSLTSDAPSFESELAGGPAWEAAARRHADDRSPLVQAAAIATPLLILQGERDTRVPSSQAVALYRALSGRDVPVEMVTYPREPHTVRERQHQVDRLLRVRAWYDRWLTGGLRSSAAAE